MKEILQDLIVTLEQGRNAVFCGIVESFGSAPRTSGARMLVLPDGSIRGSVGGGAVEGACMAMAGKILEGEESHRFLSFDMTATKAADAGMVCGGAVRVLLQRVTPDQLQFFQRLDRLRSQGDRPVLVTVMSGEESPILDVWSAREGLDGMNLPDALAEELARKAAKAPQPFSLEGDDLRVFAEPVINPSVLHLVGAGHVALATAKVAAFAGFEVVVMDDRAEFASQERYPEAREARVLESFDGCLIELGGDDFEEFKKKRPARFIATSLCISTFMEARVAIDRIPWRMPRRCRALRHTCLCHIRQ